MSRRDREREFVPRASPYSDALESRMGAACDAERPDDDRQRS
jgi:hypothetical protein